MNFKFNKNVMVAMVAVATKQIEDTLDAIKTKRDEVAKGAME